MSEVNITPEEKEEMIKEIAETIISRVKRNAYEKVREAFENMCYMGVWEKLDIHYIVSFDKNYLLDMLNKIRRNKGLAFIIESYFKEKEGDNGK
jgi:hypothetical protein